MIIGMTGIAAYIARTSRLYSFCILWFLGNLVIESSTIPLEVVYEHRTYLPSMMVILLLVMFFQQNVKKSAERQARNYNVTAKLRTFKAGQWVWVFYPPKLRDKFGRGWVGPYLVIQKLGTVDYLVQKEPGSKPITVHLDHIKEYSHDDVPPNWIGSDSPCEIATQTDPDLPL